METDEMIDQSQEVSAFIIRHGDAYNQETDDYRRASYAEPIKAKKTSAIYSAHSYHTKVPPEGIAPYIKHYTTPDGLVLDPFCGSGMTGVAAAMCERHAVLNDLSPAATHIARGYCTPIDSLATNLEFRKIKSAIHSEMQWLYGTECSRCGQAATIVYTIWSDILECSRCSSELVIWDLCVDQQNNKIRSAIECPECGARWRKTQLRWLRSEPVMTVYDCQRCKPKRHQHPTTQSEANRIAEIQSAPIPYWYPQTPFDAKDWEMWRGVHRDQGIVVLPESMWYPTETS